MAVLDGAILVIDAVAGVQPQTEAVWRAIKRTSLNNYMAKAKSSSEDNIQKENSANNELNHEPLPCLALVNKMDKDGCHFGRAIHSLIEKLPDSNPIPIQIPLFVSGNTSSIIDSMASLAIHDQLPSNIEAVSPKELSIDTANGEFIGVVDLIHMRAIIWADGSSEGNRLDVDSCAPTVIHLTKANPLKPVHESCKVTQEAINARLELIESLAEVDTTTEEQYLNDQQPNNFELCAALRRTTLAQKAVPVMAAAALKGKGLEPLLDSIADFLPSPLDRKPPVLHQLNAHGPQETLRNDTANLKLGDMKSSHKSMNISRGHPLHKSSLALAFKVVHMKGRGSGDGRVVFARVYSGNLKDREQVKVITPPPAGEVGAKERIERIGGMLELAGGRFDNVEGGEVNSGEVCALVGLKSVMTGDTLMLATDTSSSQKQKKGDKNNVDDSVYLGGVASPKPVVTVRLESETSQQETRLLEALKLLTTEDPSLLIEETESAILLSGLGELHIEITLDRLYREHGLQVTVGPPSVTYRETVKTKIETPGGLVKYDRMLGATHLQAAVHLVIEPNHNCAADDNSCVILSDPVVIVGSKARQFLGLNQDSSEENLLVKSNVARALIQGCRGALKRGILKSTEMANIICRIEDVDAEGGISALIALPGALQAAAANAVAVCLRENTDSCSLLEPSVAIEIIVPNDMVGTVISDLNHRRGTIGDVIVGEAAHSKSLIRGDVPLAEILGYANILRSLTGGEGVFNSEYRGHSFC